MKLPAKQSSRAVRVARAGVLAGALLFSGCAVLGTAADGPDSVGAQHELAAGIALYDKGDYVQAIRILLTSDEIWRASLATRVAAQKYVAFSHCLSNRPQPCKQSFSDLLRMKPDFELAAAEVGHPLWGAAFRQAQREAGAIKAEGVAGEAAGTLAHASR